MPVNLLQYCGSVGIFNNRNFFVQSKVSHFTYPSDNNNNNNNLAIGLLILSNKIVVVLLFTRFIIRCYKDVYVNSFFPRTAKLWNSLPIECFLLTYDLSGFKFRINKHLLTVGSF